MHVGISTLKKGWPLRVLRQFTYRIPTVHGHFASYEKSRDSYINFTLNALSPLRVLRQEVTGPSGRKPTCARLQARMPEFSAGRHPFNYSFRSGFVLRL